MAVRSYAKDDPDYPHWANVNGRFQEVDIYGQRFPSGVPTMTEEERIRRMAEFARILCAQLAKCKAWYGGKS